MSRYHCATLSRDLGESLAGTAPANGGSWLAVEHWGPWPAMSASAHDTLPPALREILTAAAARGIRTQLVRRPGRRPHRHRTDKAPRTVLVASSRTVQPWLEEATLDGLDVLAGLDLAAVASGRPPDFGPRSGRPVLLVCTHGRRDACCAEYGRPVAAAMAAAHPARVWETTHLSGDRFAANVSCLPFSTYHGRVSVETADAVARACLGGEVVLANYRGRAGVPPAGQAAEHAVRSATGHRGVADVRIERIEPIQSGPDGVDQVTVAAGADRFRVTVVATPTGPPRPTSCGDCPFGVPVTYQVRAVDQLRDTTLDGLDALADVQRSG